MHSIAADPSSSQKKSINTMKSHSSTHSLTHSYIMFTVSSSITDPYATTLTFPAHSGSDRHKTRSLLLGFWNFLLLFALQPRSHQHVIAKLTGASSIPLNAYPAV